jgi:prepilin-type N-terminal cleavage/methylation domain-containing protein
MTRILRPKLRSGFTIIELVVVIVIIGILATIVIVAYNGIQSSARDKSVLSDIDSLAGLETDYGLKNGGASVAWYSGSGIDSYLKFTPSNGNVIDIVANSTDYCIRSYNPASSTYKTLSTAATKESTVGTCAATAASTAAIAASMPPSNTFTTLTFTQQTVPGSGAGYSIASSSDGSKLAAADVTGYLYTSTNSGATWTQNTTGGWDHSSIASSSDGSKLAVANGNNDNSIYTSIDSGANWTQQTVPGSGAGYSIASSSDGSKLATADHNGYVYTSTDSGATWTQQTLAGSRSWSSIASSSDGSKLAAVAGAYIYTGLWH